jgi:short-subunit dehydrogenase
VTGGSSGIGRATALRLARSGARVIVVGRDEAALHDVASKTSGSPITADLSVAGEVDRAVAQALAVAGQVDVLINNAGEGWAGSFADMDLDRADRLVGTNLVAPIRLTRALLPGMLKRGLGHVVNVASIAGHVGVRDEAVYAATKAGLIAFSESLRQELADTGVGVSVVSPAVVATAFFDRRGRPYGRRWPKPIPPEKVADAIVRAVRTGKPEIFVPSWMAFPAWLRGAWPWVYRKGAGRLG